MKTEGVIYQEGGQWYIELGAPLWVARQLKDISFVVKHISYGSADADDTSIEARVVRVVLTDERNNR